MPFIIDTEQPSASNRRHLRDAPINVDSTPEAPEDSTRRGFRESWEEFKEGSLAGIRQESDIGSLVTSANTGLRFYRREKLDLDFDVFEALKSRGQEHLMEEMPDIIYADSEEEIDGFLSFRERQLADRKLLDDAGFLGFMFRAQGSLLSPWTALPAGKAVQTLKRGQGALKGALKTGGAGALAISGQEAALQASQTERSIAESSLNIAAGTFLTGTFGAILGTLNSGQKAMLRETFKDAIDQGFTIRTKDGKLEFTDDSISAARTPERVEALTQLNKNITKFTAGPLKSHTLRGLTSEFKSVQELTDDFFDSGIITEFNKLGGASRAIDKRANTEFVGMMADISKTFDAQYKQYRREVSQGLHGKKMTAGEMQRKIGHHMFTGEKSDIPAVNAMISKLKSDIEHLQKQMLELGILDEAQVKNLADPSYFTRIWNTNAVRRNPDKLRTILKDKQLSQQGWFKEKKVALKTARAQEAKLKKSGATKEAFEAAAKNTATARSDLDDAIKRIDELADKEIDAILGVDEIKSPLEGLIMGIVKGKGTKVTKERAINIPTKHFLDDGFIETDFVTVMSQFTKQATRVVELQRMLDSKGFDSLDDYLGALRAETKSKIERAVTDAEKARITKKSREAEKFMRDSVDLYFDRYFKNTKLNKSLGWLRKMVLLSRLGGVVLASLGDSMIHVMVNGIPSTSKGAWQLMATKLQSRVNQSVATKNEALVDEMRFASLGLELEMNNMLRVLADPTEDAFSQIAANNPFGKTGEYIDIGLDKTLAVFGRATLMDYWNNVGKVLAGHVSLQKTYKALQNPQTLSAAEKGRLGALGISEADYVPLKKALDKHAVAHEGGFVVDIRALRAENPELATTLSSSMRRDADRVVLTPRPADLPTFIATDELGKTWALFQSFMMTASTRLTTNLAMQRNGNALMSIIGLVGMGSLIYILRSSLAGRDVDLSFENLVLEGFNRSGVLGWWLGDMITANATGLMMDGIGDSRFAQFTLQDKVFGAAGAYIFDALGTGVKFADLDITEKDMSALMRLMPFQNVFWLRRMLEEIN